MDSNITFTRRKWVTFALLFLCLFTLLQLVYQQLKGTAVSQSVVSVLAVLPSVAVINTLAPKEKVTAQINRLVSPRARLSVLDGCEGTETIFLLFAALLAYRAGWQRTLVGMGFWGLDWSLRSTPAASPSSILPCAITAAGLMPCTASSGRWSSFSLWGFFSMVEQPAAEPSRCSGLVLEPTSWPCSRSGRAWCALAFGGEIYVNHLLPLYQWCIETCFPHLEVQQLVLNAGRTEPLISLRAAFSTPFYVGG